MSDKLSNKARKRPARLRWRLRLTIDRVHNVRSFTQRSNPTRFFLSLCTASRSASADCSYEATPCPSGGNIRSALRGPIPRHDPALDLGFGHLQHTGYSGLRVGPV